MKNIYFPEEDIVEDDLFYICFMLEKVARFVKKPTSYIVKQIGEKNLYHLLSCAQALHCDNPEKVAREWVNDYAIQEGNFICDEKYDAICHLHFYARTDPYATIMEGDYGESRQSQI